MKKRELSWSSACWTVDVVQHVGREISNEFALGYFERSPPHLFVYLLYSKEKQWWKQTRTLPVLNTGESKLYWIKKWGVLYFITFFVFLDYPGYLPAVLCLWSQAQPCGFILQLPWWCSSQLHHHLLIYRCSNCKVSAQIQQRALHKYYDKKNQIQPSLRWS